MSQTLEGVNVTGENIGPGTSRSDYPPQSAPTQEPRGVSNFVDGSGPIFSMYLEMATEEDKKMVEGWKADADGIIIFTGLFSAAVASLISVSIQDIRPNPQDTSNFYLANIYQTLANPNILSSLPTSPPPFSPPNYAIWVNALLFLSLVISITCALLATLLQQWARRYLKITQPRYSPHKRARIRAFFFEGVDKFLLPSAVDALPTLLHVSLFLFFSGIAIFLRNVHLTIFNLVLSWIGICTALYGCITFIPIFHHDSPYHTPLSLPARSVVPGILYVIFRALRRLTLLDYFSAKSYNYFQSLERRYRTLLVQGMQKTAEETALDAPSEIDTRTFLWTFNSLDEDHELERFFSGLPGFRSSTVVGDPLPSLTAEQKWNLFMALMGLLERTFSSDFLPDPIKNRRAVICAKAITPEEIPYAYEWILSRTLSWTQNKGLHTAEFGRIVRGWSDSLSGDQGTALVVRAILTSIIAKAQRHDDTWFVLASDELGIQERILRDYATHGDSLSLAILIHVTRQQFGHFREEDWPCSDFSNVLEVVASKFNVQDTSPDLRHEFCSLWNQIVLKAQNDNNQSMAWYILDSIRNVYNALHRETDSAPIGENPRDPSSYPLCNVPGHRLDSTPHVHNGSITMSFSRIASLVPASIASPEVLFLSAPAVPHADESITDVPPLDSFHPQTAHETTTESFSIPIISESPDPATSDAFVPCPTSATSTSASPLSSTSLSTALAFQHNVDPLAPSDPPNPPLLAASNPVLDNILPTGSRLPIMVTVAPTASPGPTSTPVLGAAAEDDGSQMPGLRGNMDALGTLSANRAIDANTTPALGLPPPPPSLPPVTDSGIAIASPSMWEPNAERIGDHPPRPSHAQYDIV